MPKTIGEVRKALAAVATVLGIIVSQNIAHGTALRWVNFAIALVGAIIVFLVPNDTAKPQA